jgi:predicted glycosyltransferase
VIIPFEEGRESEQRQRAEALAVRGLITLLPERRLAPETLLSTVRAVLQRPQPEAGSIALDGLARTIDVLGALARGEPPQGLRPS